jgi:acetolactate synthase-1/2/3 large subunit/sulfoacetaldehyde acetyltransferase
MVLGLAQAKLAYAPVVVLTGLPSTEHLGRDTFQEIDQHVLFQPVTKRTFTVPRSERIPEFILEAYRVANTGRRGPVVVNIPRDLFNQEIDVTLPCRAASRWWRAARSMAPLWSTSRRCCRAGTRPGDPCRGRHQWDAVRPTCSNSPRHFAAADHDLGWPWRRAPVDHPLYAVALAHAATRWRAG